MRPVGSGSPCLSLASPRFFVALANRMNQKSKRCDPSYEELGREMTTKLADMLLGEGDE
jgi:hypothetical protein